MLTSAGGGVFPIPATRIAEELGRKMMANIVMLGFITSITGTVSVEGMLSSVAESVPKGTEEANIAAFNKGYDFGQALLKARQKKGRRKEGGRFMKNPKERLQRVCVIGATPAGIAATNKLGEMGIPVTLIDEAPDLNEKLASDVWRMPSGVGFNYALRPGLLRIMRNPGIRLLLPASVKSIKHTPQGFSVRHKKMASYVDARQVHSLRPLLGELPGNRP